MGAISRKEDGTRNMTPSILRDLEIRHSITVPEAERLFHLIEAGEDEDASAEMIKADRRVFRSHTEYVVNPSSNALTAAEERRKRLEQEAHEPSDQPEDKTAPEAGPYGPNSEYTEGSENVTRASDLYR